MRPALTIAPLGAADVGAWAEMVREGFGLSTARVAHFRAGVGDRDIRVAHRDGRAAGTVALLPMAQWFGGRPVPAVGVAAVTVAPRERRAGVADTLLRATLDEARGRGFALAVLHAATLPLYARLGFARAGLCVDYRLSVARTLAPLADPARRAPLRLSRPARADIGQLDALRRRQARWSNGLVGRPPLLWANLLEPSEMAPPDLVLIHGEDGAPEGFLLLRPPGDGATALRLADACLLSGDAARQTLGLLAGQAGRAMVVEWPGGPDDALAHLAPETEVDIEDWDTWLARVLDVPGALRARGWPEGLGASLDLEVDDPLLVANHGRWRLTVAAGRASVEARAAADPATPTLRTPIAALAPLVTGHLSAPALRAMGALDGDDHAVALAATLFAGPAPWLADRF